MRWTWERRQAFKGLEEAETGTRRQLPKFAYLLLFLFWKRNSILATTQRLTFSLFYSSLVSVLLILQCWIRTECRPGIVSFPF